MAKPRNRSYFPLMRTLPEHKTLNRKQVAAVRRALAKVGRKLPRVGYCATLTKIGGKFSNIVGSPEHSTSEICHEGAYRGGKARHVYTLVAKPARSRRAFR